MSGDGSAPLVPDRLSPDWEPQDVQLHLRVTRSFAAALAAYAEELGLSQSLFMREAIRRGLPALVNDVRFLRSKGYRPAAYLEGVASGPGGSGDGMRRSAPQWVSVPGDVDRSAASRKK